MRALRRTLAVITLSTLCTFSATKAIADGSIDFIHGGLAGPTNINNGNVFAINLINGSDTTTFLNKTGKTIKDFHFTWANNLAVKGFDDLPDGQTKPFFGSYTAAVKALDFFDQAAGVGIAPNEKFNISIVGFTGMNAVMANATFDGGKGTTVIPGVPEPSQAIALLVGLGVLGGVVRYQKKLSVGSAAMTC